jgi:hypothetical protein
MHSAGKRYVEHTPVSRFAVMLGALTGRPFGTRPSASQRRMYEEMAKWNEEEAKIVRERTENPMLLLGNGDASITRRTGSFSPLPVRVLNDTPSLIDAVGIDVGDIVKLVRCMEHGVVRYVGKTYFGTGVWIGIDLDSPSGKHDGAVCLHSCFSPDLLLC